MYSFHFVESVSKLGVGHLQMSQPEKCCWTKTHRSKKDEGANPKTKAEAKSYLFVRKVGAKNEAQTAENLEQKLEQKSEQKPETAKHNVQESDDEPDGHGADHRGFDCSFNLRPIIME